MKKRIMWWKFLLMMLLLPVMVITSVPGEGGGEGGDAGAGGDGGAAGGGSVLGDGGAAAGGDPGAGGEDDLSKLFTPELIEARKAELAATKAEEERRAGLTEAERAEEDRLKAEEAAKSGVPEAYDIKFPDGMEPIPELLAEFTPLAKELGLNNEQAQKLADFEAKLVAHRMESFNQMTENWLAAAKADKEIGGDVWDESLEVGERTINTFGTPELKTLLNQYKLGRHPEMIRFAARIGKAIREDGIVLSGAESKGKGDIASRLYGGEKQ